MPDGLTLNEEIAWRYQRYIKDYLRVVADPLDQPGAHGPVDPVEWELFDVVVDPYELDNVIDDPAYATVRDELRSELARLQAEVGDTPYPGL